MPGLCCNIGSRSLLGASPGESDTASLNGPGPSGNCAVTDKQHHDHLQSTCQQRARPTRNTAPSIIQCQSHKQITEHEYIPLDKPVERQVYGLSPLYRLGDQGSWQRLAYGGKCVRVTRPLRQPRTCLHFPSPHAGLDLTFPGPTGLGAWSPPFPHKAALTVSGWAKLHSVALLGTHTLQTAFCRGEGEKGWNHTARADKATAGNSSPAHHPLLAGASSPLPSPPDRLSGPCPKQEEADNQSELSLGCSHTWP